MSGNFDIFSFTILNLILHVGLENESPTASTDFRPALLDPGPS